MDQFDRASELEAAYTAQAIRAALPPKTTKDSATECAWCGDDIPEGRQEAVPGCDLCTRCQDQKERLKERR